MTNLSEEHENKCIECENDTLLKYSDLYIEYDRLKKYVNLLEQGFDNAQALNQTLREVIEKLENKLRCYTND